MNGVEGERWRRLARNGGKRSLMMIREVQHTTHGDVFLGSAKLQAIYHKERVEETVIDMFQMLICDTVSDYSIPPPEDETFTRTDPWGSYIVNRRYNRDGVNFNGRISTGLKENESPANSKSFKSVRWRVGDKEYDDYVEMINKEGWLNVSLSAVPVEWECSFGVSISVSYRDYFHGSGSDGSPGSKTLSVSKRIRVRKTGEDNNGFSTYSIVSSTLEGTGTLSGEIKVGTVSYPYTKVDYVNINDADFPKGKDVPKVRT